MNLKTFALLLFLAFEPNKSLQQDPELQIFPPLAKTNEKVEITCRNNREGSGAVYFTITRTKNAKNSEDHESVQIVRMDVKCSDGTELKRNVFPGFGNIRHSGCTSIVISDVPATKEVAGRYGCSLQHIMADFSQVTSTSQPVQLTVGDPTPRVSRFELAYASTGVPLPPNGQVAAGTNVSVTCETAPADPAPGFTVTAGSGGAPLSMVKPDGDMDSRVMAFVLVPKQPLLTYHCKASNGFGDEQQADVTVNVVYDAVHSEVRTPTEMTFQTADEVKICSVVNNPPKRLAITGLDSNLLQPLYPRYEEKNGESLAYVKLAEGARSQQELKYTCSISGLDIPATVKLQGLKPDTTPAPSSAMMTAGIAVAVGAALVIAIGIVVAVVMKKRKASDKSSNGDNTRYGKVNQNDADHAIFDAHPTTKSIRVEDSKPGEYNEA